MEAARIASVLRHLAPGSSAAIPAAAAAAEAPPRVRVQEEHYYTYAELKAVCEEVAAAYPTLCSLSSIGRSREGRELWLLTLTDLSTGPADAKPAYCIYGNIHASEPTGAHAAVYNAVHLCEREGGPTGLLRRAAVYIIPRVAVDGAEYCVTTGGAPLYPRRSWAATTCPRACCCCLLVPYLTGAVVPPIVTWQGACARASGTPQGRSGCQTGCIRRTSTAPARSLTCASTTRAASGWSIRSSLG
jgi:hypothetical protein